MAQSDLPHQPTPCHCLPFWVPPGPAHYADTLVPKKTAEVPEEKTVPACPAALLQEWRQGKAASYHPSPGPCAVALADLTETLGIDDAWTVVRSLMK